MDEINKTIDDVVQNGDLNRFANKDYTNGFMEGVEYLESAIACYPGFDNGREVGVQEIVDAIKVLKHYTAITVIAWEESRKLDKELESFHE